MRARMSTMAAPAFTVIIPAFNEAGVIPETIRAISAYFDTTGLEYELLVIDDGSTDETVSVVAAMASSNAFLRIISLEENSGKGAAVRRGVAEARGSTIAFIDADLPYRVQNLGDAIALVQSGSTDIAIGARDLRSSQHDDSYPWLRRLMGKTFSLIVRAFLVPQIPDTQCGLKAFSAASAKLLFAESRLRSFGFDFEILFLARKYGFRIERIAVSMSHRHESKVRLFRDSLSMLIDVLKVRRNNRRLLYRAPRRCPVCFSAEIMTLTQIRSHVVRRCARCKCRYLNQFPDEQELLQLYSGDYFHSGDDLSRGYANREPEAAVLKTNRKRIAMLSKLVGRRGRVLEVGAGNGTFGVAASKEFEYAGIDLSEQGVREARSRGLEVYRASLSDYLNTGSPFDAVAAFHVFEHLSDPHDALARVRDLLKPGGHLILVTPDTESLLCVISGDRWVSYKFPEHLILYSRSALIELLEHSGYEITSINSDFEYCDHPFLLSRLGQLHPVLEAAARVLLPLLPRLIPVSSGSIRIVARRRSGPPVNLRAIRAVEPTHAR